MPSPDTTAKLKEIWPEILSLLSNGLSIIPVRTKQQTINNRIRPAKSPYNYWTNYQHQIISPEELWDQMNKFDTTSISVITGTVSGNLEVIDVDVKYKDGIDAILFNDIKLIYPELFDKLRIHKSPSGGYHILYKILDTNPQGNMSLAKRLIKNKEGIEKPAAFLETRGEGGYVVYPPSLGYSIHKPNPIPVITIHERNSLIALCEGYNEILKIEKQPKTNKFDETYYSENPFDHYNNSEVGANLLLDFGWKYNKENPRYIWYTKPNSTSGERHASWIKEKRVFYFFTTSTEFADRKCYTPSSVLAKGKFNDDYKKTYQYLVQNGYGKIRPVIENKIILKAKELPGNISDSGRARFELVATERIEAHPYGIYWEIEPDSDRITISREGLYEVSNRLGFRLYKGLFFRVYGRFLRQITEREYQDTLKGYIREKDPGIRLQIINTYEHFLQVAGKFTLTRIRELQENEIMRDTRYKCYKFYQDCWVEIDRNGYVVHQYEEMNDLLMFESKLLKRNFSIANTGVFIDFIEKALNYTERKDYINSVIGYLAHDYKDESLGYIVLLTEECENPKDGGGSGKNLLCNLFKNITTKTDKAGSQIKYDEKFLQTWNMERLFVISDAPKNFDFMFLKELASGEGVWKKLWKDEVSIQPELMPKFVIQTNYSYNDADGGLKRRIIPIEFSDFFTKAKGVDVYYKKFFPSDWTQEDWNGFDYVMVNAIQKVFELDLKLSPKELTNFGFRKQFEQKYHNLLQFIEDYKEMWFTMQEVNNSDFKRHQEDFCKENKISEFHWPGIKKINDAIREYMNHYKHVYKNDVSKGMYKIRIFFKENTPF